MSVLTFDQFEAQVNALLPNRIHRLQFRNNTEDLRLQKRLISRGGNIFEFEFQDLDPGYFGRYSPIKGWFLMFNGATGCGATIEEADAALENAYNLIL